MISFIISREFLAAQDSIGVTYGIEATRQRIRDLLSLHMQLDQQIAECEAGMEAIMDTIGIQDYLLSIPGVGQGRLTLTFHGLQHINASVIHLLKIPDKYAMKHGGWKTGATMKAV